MGVVFATAGCLGSHRSEHALDDYRSDPARPIHAPTLGAERERIGDHADDRLHQVMTGRCSPGEGKVTWFQGRFDSDLGQRWAYVGGKLAYVESVPGGVGISLGGGSVDAFGTAPLCTPEDWSALPPNWRP